jgi:penicillin-binding protein A
MILLLQSWPGLDSIFGGQILERTPAGLSIVYLIGVAIVVVFLLITLFGQFRRWKFKFERGVDPAVAKRFTNVLANRSLRAWQVVFVLLAAVTFAFHVYWVRAAADPDSEMQALSYKDLRGRRTSAGTLRGWMLDRTGELDATLALYKLNEDGKIKRSYPLEREMAHLLGTERGTPGLERALYKRIADPMPEAWEVLTTYRKPEPEKKDVRVSIDRDLQTYSAKLLEGKKGAIVVLNPQTGDVLAMYSNPSYKLSDVETLDGYLKAEADKANNPLLSRATREFYVPGSTFKTLTMVSAFRAGRQGLSFPGRPAPDCYTPFRGSRPICDSGGSCNACSENIPLIEAFKVSSNQYFAQMSNALGRERMGETARQFGIMPVEDADAALKQGFFPGIWNVSDPRIANAISPARSTIATGKELTLFDFGLIGIGQGLASQMTPFQMALIAAGAGNTQGRLMKPKIEADRQPEAFSQLLSPEQARVVREIMATVTEEAGGTGTIVKSKLGTSGIVVGGKTGTSEKDGVPAYDADGKRKFTLRKKRNEDGTFTDEKVFLTYRRTDGWFICIAPIENPQLAIAVVIEDIGEHRYGGATAGPVAADLILKARDLGLLGERYNQRITAPAPAPVRRRR